MPHDGQHCRGHEVQVLQGVANGENGAKESRTSTNGIYPGSPPEGKDLRPSFAFTDYSGVYNGGDRKRWA
jgi:hypothetical protein